MKNIGKDDRLPTGGEACVLMVHCNRLEGTWEGRDSALKQVGMIFDLSGPGYLLDRVTYNVGAYEGAVGQNSTSRRRGFRRPP